MKATRFIFLIIIFLIILIPFSVSAQIGKFYLTLNPGFYSPQTDDLEDFDTGFSGEVALGCQFNKNLSGEIGLGFFDTLGEFYETGFINGYFYTAIQDLFVDVAPVTFTLKAIYPVEKWDLYALGGIGFYFVSGETDVDMLIDGYYISASLEDSDTVLGGHLGLGFHYNINPGFFIGAETKYLWTNDAKLKDYIFDVPIEAKFNLNGFFVTGVVGFRF